MTALSTIPRPGMRDYRPRIAPHAEHWTEPDGTAGVTVYRTHDLESALMLALLTKFVSDWPGVLAHDGERVWLRRDRGRSWVRVDPGKRGAVAASVFRVEL